jgi:hypothetical protein
VRAIDTLRRGLVLVAFSSVGLGCRSAETHETYIEPPAAWAKADPDATPTFDFYGPDDPFETQSVFGATILARDFRYPCRLETRRISSPPGEDFVATILAERGTIFPMPKHLVALGACNPTQTDDHGRTFPPVGVLELRAPASFDWAAPKPGNVFIPLQGEAILDHDYHATAILDVLGDAGTSALSATITTTRPKEADDQHPHMRPMDSFRWGNRRATVVRIIEPIAKAAGWVEIELTGLR